MTGKNKSFIFHARRGQDKSEGFTLIEIIVVSAVVLILLAFASVNLFNIPTSSSIDATVDTVAEDLKTQQIKAMAGDTEGRGIPDKYGMYITPSSYTVFHGSTYNPNDTANFRSDLPAGYSLSTTLPNSIVIFAAGSGEILNFSNNQNTITVKNDATGKQKTIFLNTYGTITNIQ